LRSSANCGGGGADRCRKTQGRLRQLAGAECRCGEGLAAARCQRGRTDGLNEKLTAKRAGLEKQIAQLPQTADLTRTELAELKTRAANSDRTAREHIATINELRETNQKLQARLGELGGRVTALQAENARLAVSCDAVTGIRAELADVKLKLGEVRQAADKSAAVVTELTGGIRNFSAI
jgi:chromosome segregation ATPase